MSTELIARDKDAGERRPILSHLGTTINSLPLSQRPFALFFAAFISTAYGLQKAFLFRSPDSWKLDLDSDYRERIASLCAPGALRERLITSIPIALSLFLLTLPRNHLHHQLIPTVLAVALLLVHLISRELFIYRDKKWIDRMTNPIKNLLGERVDLEQFKLPLRPILLWGAYLVAPFALLMMLTHAIRELFGPTKAIESKPDDAMSDCLNLRQCVNNDQVTRRSTFFLSPTFSWTMLTIFVSGVPALVAYAFYQLLGIDALLGFPSRDPHFFKILFIGLYISSVCWCAMSLFTRAYFTFPLNFTSTECDITLDADSIRKSGFKGWFATLMYWSLEDVFERKIDWHDVTSISISSGRLRPLPETVFNRESMVYKFLDKMAALTDAVGDRLGRKEYLLINGETRTNRPERDVQLSYLFMFNFIEVHPGKAPIEMSVRLWELNKEERAKLFYALRKWAPEIHLNKEVQEKLIGSAVLRDVRYTDIWFNILTSAPARLRERCLTRSDALQNGNYLIESKLDTGGQAVVYLAKSLEGTDVVLKEFVLPTGEGVDALVESAADFENESTILSQLSHPKIVKMQDLFIEDHRVYLALEKVEGCSLRKLVKESGPLDEHKVLNLALQMCDILSYLHGLVPPLVHRDFTPDNLILSAENELKLVDFSIAQQAQSEKLGDCAGKHAYTPPEQFRAEACPQSDVYAMGATLYFLLVGSDPVPISTSHVRQLRPEVSEALDTIIAKATALNLEQRYESIKWLQLDLTAVR
jgi:serine/threonine-protein kinase